MSRPVYARGAQADIMEIWAFNAERSEQKANRMVQDIDAKCELILDYPNLGRARPEIGSGYRSLPVGKYVIYYQVRGERISISRVLSAHQDISGITWLDDDPALPS